MNSKTVLEQRKMIASVLHELNHLDIVTSIKKILQIKDITLEEFFERTGFNDCIFAEIYRVTEIEHRRISFRLAMTICIGLRLDAFDAIDFMENRAGYTFTKAYTQSLAYQELLGNYYNADIQICNKKLAEWGRPEEELLGAWKILKDDFEDIESEEDYE